MRQQAHAVAVAVSLAAVAACANGGPVEWLKNGVSGALVPRSTPVRLKSETLELRLLEDLKRYKANARYTLENAGAAQRVSFGVPLYWRAGGSLADSAALVRISIGDQRPKCAPEASTVEPDPKRSEEETEAGGWSGWCVAELELPAGIVVLNLEYESDLEYEDWMFTKSPLTEFSARTLTYQLHPAGAWQGPVESLDVRVHLGPWVASGSSISLPGARTEDGVLVWSGKGVDLTKLREFSIKIEDEGLLKSDELAHWAKRTGIGVPPLALEVKASSVLASQGANSYSPNNLIDGRPETAWCEGQPGTAGAWFEIRVKERPKISEYCKFFGFAATSGYIKSSRSFADNPRAMRLKVSRCDDPGLAKEVPMPLTSTGHRNDARPLIWRNLMPALDETSQFFRALSGEGSGSRAAATAVYLTRACVRVDVIEAAPAKTDDLCLSEFAPIIHCY
jgi:hypothetical protein